MKVRKYVGSNMQEAMYKLKSDLGPDALILSTRTVRRKGFLGFFKKPLIEIIAASDKERISREDIKYDRKLNDINKELVELKKLMASANNHTSNQDGLTNRLHDYRKSMVKNGVDYDIATTLLKSVNNQVDISKKDDDSLKKIINYNLLEFLGPVEPIDLNQGLKTIFFVGPTGVGKTTTLAKIAAKLVLEGGKDIGLLTADTYRIAAVEQLKIYSDILKLPLKIIYESDEIDKGLEEYKGMDLVLVDTAGRNHKDGKQIEELKELVNRVDKKEVFLVLSATTDPMTLKNIIKQYSFLDEYKIIFTKLDEAGNYGNILNTKFYIKNPLSYITTGQNVPEDIKLANINEIVECVIGEY